MSSKPPCSNPRGDPTDKGAASNGGSDFIDEQRKIVGGAQFIISQYKENGEGPLPVPEMPGEEMHKGNSSRSRPAVASPAASVTTLCNTAVGAGVLAFPFAFRMAGVFGGLLLCVLCCLLEGFTLYVLSKFSERHRSPTYAKLIRATLGRKLSALLPPILCIYSFGSCAAYMIILGDYFSSWARGIFGEGVRFTDRTTLIIVTGFVVMLPLCLARRLNALATVSSVALFGFIFLAFVVMKEGYDGFNDRQPSPFADIVWFKWDVDFLYAIPIVSFGFNCHVNAIPVFQELTERPCNLLGISEDAHGRKTPKLMNMISAVLCSSTICLIGYVAVGLSGYLGFPLATPNMFNSFPQTALVQGAKVVISFIVIINYPLTHFPARECGLEMLAMMGCQSASESNIAYVAFTALYVSGTVAVAVAVTDLGLVLNILGGTMASFLIFFTPGLMLINSAIKRECSVKLDSLQKSLHGSLQNSLHGSLQNSLHGSLTGSRQDLGSMEHHDLSAPLLKDFNTEAGRLLMDYPALAVLDQAALRLPVRLHRGSKKGIKKTGIIYSPGKEWAVGMFFLLLSFAMVSITVYTAIVR